jgi:hypothetical protein
VPNEVGEDEFGSSIELISAAASLKWTSNNVAGIGLERTNGNALFFASGKQPGSVSYSPKN